MRTLKLHFSVNKKGAIFSRLLQWYQGLNISHVLVEYDTPHLGTNMVYHSVIGNGVSFMTKERFLEKNTITETFIILLEEDVYKKIRNKLTLECGEHYGILQNLGIPIVDFMKNVFKLKIQNPFKSGSNCSELIYEHVINNIFSEIEDISINTVKPIDIRNILLTQGYIPVFSIIKEK